MARRADSEGREVVCPHCKKAFTPEPLVANQNRQQGFKCPHCRLFVASDRADEAAAQA
jgi:transposase-like protein